MAVSLSVAEKLYNRVESEYATRLDFLKSNAKICLVGAMLGYALTMAALIGMAFAGPPPLFRIAWWVAIVLGLCVSTVLLVQSNRIRRDLASSLSVDLIDLYQKSEAERARDAATALLDGVNEEYAKRTRALIALSAVGVKVDKDLIAAIGLATDEPTPPTPPASGTSTPPAGGTPPSPTGGTPPPP
jgi:hypothetical protein